ncbi:MAG: peptidoglycan DD-metalloendopeptidase family protein [candidate division WOR-3 bacterium]
MEQVNFVIAFVKRNRILRTNLPIYLLYCVIGLIGLSLALGVFSFLSLNQRLREQNLIKILTKENSTLRRKLGYIENEVARLKERLLALAEFDTKLRLASAIELVPQDVRAMGIGGIASVNLTNENADLLQIEKTLAELNRQVQFQEVSFAEIEKHLKQQETVLNHTPSIWPVCGWVSSGYGYRRDPFTGRKVMHNGIDIVAPPGTPIVATADGRVCFAGIRPGYGKVIEIDHGYGYITFYGHCQSIRKGYGEKVTRGEVIATVGRSGKTTGYHLHYGVKVSGTWVNPLNYILDNYAVVD